MKAIRNPKATSLPTSLKRLAVPIAAALAMGVVAIGVGAGPANATSVQVNCPASVKAGHPFGVTLSGWLEGGSLTGWLDTNHSVNNPEAFSIAVVDKNLATSQLFYEQVPALPAGRHNLVVQEVMPPPYYNGFQTGCDFDVT